MKIHHASVAAAAIATAVSLPLTVSAQTAPAAAPASPHTVTGNVALTSDYIFRGLSQTNGDPAIQGGLDYSHASG
ncbi:MAG TPA: TorF family putative porin, partial [Burkholderiales bacterium]